MKDEKIKDRVGHLRSTRQELYGKKSYASIFLRPTGVQRDGSLGVVLGFVDPNLIGIPGLGVDLDFSIFQLEFVETSSQVVFCRIIHFQVLERTTKA